MLWMKRKLYKQIAQTATASTYRIPGTTQELHQGLRLVSVQAANLPRQPWRPADVSLAEDTLIEVQRSRAMLRPALAYDLCKSSVTARVQELPCGVRTWLDTFVEPITMRPAKPASQQAHRGDKQGTHAQNVLGCSGPCR